MPQQPGTGVGAGSCGVGVILAARDFLEGAPAVNPNFRWAFGEMNRFRIEMMVKVKSWMED